MRWGRYDDYATYAMIVVMSSYKVPQDVEADDKLLGPFSFRQFIYLLVTVGAIALAYAMAVNLFVGLAIVPLPIIIFFGALALPIKKDQPMETYLAAVVSFYLKPRVRLWKPDGVESLIEITVPKETEVQRVKDLSAEETSQRLSYLANVLDTEGWAIKGLNESPLKEEFFNESMSVVDMLDNTQNIDRIIEKNDQERRNQIVDGMRLAIERNDGEGGIPGDRTLSHFGSDSQSAADMSSTTDIDAAVAQIVAKGNQDEARMESTIRDKMAEDVVSPDIINLISNSDLSVETLAKEANRLNRKDESGEIFVPLR